MSVTADGVVPPIQITVDQLEGMAPLTANFTFVSSSSASLQIRFRISGGTATLVQTGPDMSSVTYPDPGTYPTSVTVTDDLGHSVTQDFVVVVQDPALMDSMLRALWRGMTNALAAGDKASALNYLSDSAQAKYGPVFDTLSSEMPQIVGSFSVPIVGVLSTDLAEYVINRTIDENNHVFFVYYLRGPDGLWKLHSM